MVFMDKVGGCLTVTVCIDEVTEPHVLPDILSEIEYVPGVTKLNEGFCEDEEVFDT